MRSPDKGSRPGAAFTPASDRSLAINYIRALGVAYGNLRRRDRRSDRRGRTVDRVGAGEPAVDVGGVTAEHAVGVEVPRPAGGALAAVGEQVEAGVAVLAHPKRAP